MQLSVVVLMVVEYSENACGLGTWSFDTQREMICRKHVETMLMSLKCLFQHHYYCVCFDKTASQRHVARLTNRLLVKSDSNDEKRKKDDLIDACQMFFYSFSFFQPNEALMQVSEGRPPLLITSIDW